MAEYEIIPLKAPEYEIIPLKAPAPPPPSIPGAEDYDAALRAKPPAPDELEKRSPWSDVGNILPISETRQSALPERSWLDVGRHAAVATIADVLGFPAQVLLQASGVAGDVMTRLNMGGKPGSREAGAAIRAKTGEMSEFAGGWAREMGWLKKHERTWMEGLSDKLGPHIEHVGKKTEEETGGLITKDDVTLIADAVMAVLGLKGMKATSARWDARLKAKAEAAISDGVEAAKRARELQKQMEVDLGGEAPKAAEAAPTKTPDLPTPKEGVFDVEASRATVEAMVREGLLKPPEPKLEVPVSQGKPGATNAPRIDPVLGVAAAGAAGAAIGAGAYIAAEKLKEDTGVYALAGLAALPVAASTVAAVVPWLRYTSPVWMALKKELGKNHTVTAAQLKGVLGRQGISQAEREIFEGIMAGRPSVTVKELAEGWKVATEDLELTPRVRTDSGAWSDYGLERIDRLSTKQTLQLAGDEVRLAQLRTQIDLAQNAPANPDGTRTIHVAGGLRRVRLEDLEAELDLANAPTTELIGPAARTTLYLSPIQLGVANHFGDPNYFAHTRSFVDRGVRHVVEVQSDLAQKAGKKLTREELIALQQRLKTAQESWQHYFNLRRQLVPGRPLEVRAGVMEELRRDPVFAEAIKRGENNLVFMLNRAIDGFDAEIAEIISKVETQRINPVRPILKDWWKRIVREEIAQAQKAHEVAKEVVLKAEQGPPIMRFASPDTVAKVEGWPLRFGDLEGSIRRIRNAIEHFESLIAEQKQLLEARKRLVATINRQLERNPGDKKLMARRDLAEADVQKTLVEIDNLKGDVNNNKAQLSVLEYELERANSTLGRFEPEHQGIYNRYVEIAKWLEKEYAARPYTDPQGHTWLEVDLPAEASPVRMWGAAAAAAGLASLIAQDDDAAEMVAAGLGGLLLFGKPTFGKSVASFLKKVPEGPLRTQLERGFVMGEKGLPDIDRARMTLAERKAPPALLAELDGLTRQLESLSHGTSQVPLLDTISGGAMFDLFHNLPRGSVDTTLLKAVAAVGAGTLAAYLSDPEDKVWRGLAVGAITGLVLHKASTDAGVASLAKSSLEKLDYVVGNVSSTVRTISEPVLRRMTKFELDLKKIDHERIGGIAPLVKGLKKLSQDQRDQLSMAALTGSPKELAQVLTDIGDPELVTKVLKAREVMKEIGAELKDLGLIKDPVPEYWPRIIRDRKGLLEAIGKEEKLLIEEELKKANDRSLEKRGVPLDEFEEALIVNRFLKAPSGTGKPGFTKERGIRRITPELLQYYVPLEDAIPIYVQGATRHLERVKFFGKDLVRDTEGRVNLSDSIGALVAKEVKARNLTLDQERILRQILRDRFGPGEMAPSQITALYRNLTYLGTLANLGSASVQLADSFLAASMHGPINAIKGLAARVTGDTRWALKDVGLVNALSDEFVTGSRNVMKIGGKRVPPTAQFLDKSLRASLFTYIDEFGKSMILNASYQKFASWAKSEKGQLRIRKEYGDYFRGDIDQLIQDLRSGEKTVLVEELVFRELSDMQPITKIEVPQAYLAHPDMRAAYTLRTFMLKQVNLARDKGIRKMRNGDVPGGMMHLARLALGLAAGGMAADLVRQLISKGLTEHELNMPEWHEAVISVTRTFGWSQAAIDMMRKGDLKGAAAWIIMPPLGPYEDLWRGDERAVRPIPVVGKIIYDRMLGGNEKAAAREAQAEAREEREESGEAERRRERQKLIKELMK